MTDIDATREVKQYAMFITEAAAKEESLHPVLIEQAVKGRNITVLRWEVQETEVSALERLSGVSRAKTYALIWYGYENN